RAMPIPTHRRSKPRVLSAPAAGERGCLDQRESARRPPPSRRRQTLFRELQHRHHLIAANARKPTEKVVDSGAILQVLEERLDGHTSISKYPRAAHSFRGALHGGTMAPVEP